MVDEARSSSDSGTGRLPAGAWWVGWVAGGANSRRAQVRRIMGLSPLREGWPALQSFPSRVELAFSRVARPRPSPGPQVRRLLGRLNHIDRHTGRGRAHAAVGGREAQRVAAAEVEAAKVDQGR